MQHLNSIRLPLVFLLLAVMIGGCGTYAPDLVDSLRTTKQRIDEAKKDHKQQPAVAQYLYEAELYWQRAWHARRDPAEANHLLFMAQGKIAIARSLAALKKAEEQLAAKSKVRTKNNRNQMIAARSNSVVSGGPIPTKAVSYNTTRAKARESQKKSARQNVVAKEIDAAAMKKSPASEQLAAASPAVQIENKPSQPSSSRTDPAPAVTSAKSRQPASSLPGKSEIRSTEDDIAPTPETVPPADTSPADIVAPVKTVEKVQPNEPNETPAAQAMKVEAITSPQPAPQPKEAKGNSTAVREQELANLDPHAKEEMGTVPSEDMRSAKSRNSGLNNFYSNIPEYCRSIAGMISGGKKVVQTCNELELAAKKRLMEFDRAAKKRLKPVESHSMILNYCTDVARALGAGYQILEMCIDQELGSRPKNNDPPKGFVMGEGGKSDR